MNKKYLNLKKPLVLVNKNDEQTDELGHRSKGAK